MNDELDKILDTVELELKKDSLPVSQNNTPQPPQSKVDVSDEDSLAEEIMRMASDDRKQADKIFDLFYGNISLSKDSSQASKEALLRAMELKIESGRNVIEVLKVKAKKSENMKTANGVMINVLNEKKTGISVSNILDHIDD